MFEHYSVLLDETIDALNIKEDGIYVDCTLGGGGHSSRILEKLTTGHLYCFDQDTHAIEAARERLSKISDNFTIIHANFNSGNAVNGYQMVNRADVGGKYQGTWQTAQASWVTIIQKLWSTPNLPKTGY